MRKYIDAEKLIAEIKAWRNKQMGFAWDAVNEALKIITSLQQEQLETNEEEKSLSLQIQAYLITASDELYAPGKPLYTKQHYEGVHECMKMWQKLHQYYFSTKQEQPEVDLEKEIDHYLYGENFVRKYDGVYVPGARMRDWKNPNVGKTLYGNELTQFARHFYEL